MGKDVGVPPSGSGCQASPSAVPASRSGIPNACRNCAGEQWVCENHRDQPWEASGHAANCGAGAPCPVCRPDMANAHLLELASRAASKIDSMERDQPGLVDWDAKGPDLSEQIEAAVARYKTSVATPLRKAK